MRTDTKGAAITYRMVLADGRRFEMTPARRPKFWKSDVMRLAPYGSNFCGATFARVAK